MKKTLPNRRKAPASLADFQRWFARAASRPLLPGNATSPRGVDGPDLPREANARLRSRGGMSGLERLEVYNRQYWFRLITILQEEFPCCLHVIGLDAFNAWAIRYLGAHPPISPYLADLDRDFPAFLRRRLRGSNRDRAVEAAAYDKAFSRAFDAPPFDSPGAGAQGTAHPGTGTAAITAETRWTLAPHVTPLWLQWDFTAYRALCLRDEALTGRFPLRRAGRPGGSGRGVCLHRHENTPYEKKLSRAEFLLLSALGRPRTLDQVFRAVRKAATVRDLEKMERNATAWFREWTELGWITEECFGNDSL